MAQVSASAILQAYISSAWVTLDDVQPWTSKWGMSENGPLSFLADTGELKFRLNNADGLYTPGGPSALAGFKRGVPVRILVTFEGETYVKDRGYISDIETRPRISDKTIGVTCLDWLDYASRHPIVNPGILLNKYSNEVMTAIT
jgi:hypothetical protein